MATTAESFLPGPKFVSDTPAVESVAARASGHDDTRSDGPRSFSATGSGTDTRRGPSRGGRRWQGSGGGACRRPARGRPLSSPSRRRPCASGAVCRWRASVRSGRSERRKDAKERGWRGRSRSDLNRSGSGGVAKRGTRWRCGGRGRAPRRRCRFSPTRSGGGGTQSSGRCSGPEVSSSASARRSRGGKGSYSAVTRGRGSGGGPCSGGGGTGGTANSCRWGVS